ncbi:MAG: hypothetical protein ABH821_01135, partial [archaeon]
MKGQTGIELLLLIGGAILIAVIVVSVLFPTLESGNEIFESEIDSFEDLMEQDNPLTADAGENQTKVLAGGVTGLDATKSQGQSLDFLWEDITEEVPKELCNQKKCAGKFFDIPEEYPVKLTITDEFERKETDEITIQVNEQEKTSYFGLARTVLFSEEWEERLETLNSFNVQDTRVVIDWEDFQPNNESEWIYPNPKTNRIKQIIESGVNVVPTIKILDGWYTVRTQDEGWESQSVPPADLTESFGEYGYSESYYNFINRMTEDFLVVKGINRIVIENETAALRYWQRDPSILDEEEEAEIKAAEDYAKVYLTAVKAVQDSGANIKVLNSGQGSGVWA